MKLYLLVLSNLVLVMRVQIWQVFDLSYFSKTITVTLIHTLLHFSKGRFWHVL